ncbi:MAG: sulfite exporter TauE/SafE family protein, partial [Pseudomonadota bacterium]
IALSNVWATTVLAASMARFDLFGGTDFVASLLALIPAFAGLAIGQWLRGYINEDLFRKTLAGVLFLIGLNLIRKALD